MKAYVYRTSNYDNTTIKEFKTLEDLLKFADTCGHKIIIDKNRLYTDEFPECEYGIEIYDGWRE